MTELHDLTAVDQRAALARAEVSPTELTEHYLGRVARLNPEMGAFVTVTGEAARERARRVEAAGDSGEALWGLPSGDKDLWRRAGVAAGYGSRLMSGFVPGESDEIVEVLDSAGAISLGKTNAPEFGMPSYTETLVAPPARNPWDPRLGAGGSSGGAAAAVAAGMLPLAPGSDGGGSIRIPAAACGLVGLKPSRGRVPAGSGVAGLGGLVVDGPIARTVADAALLLDGMIPRTGARVEHHYSLRAPEGGPFLPAALAADPGGALRVGILTDSAWDAAYEIDAEQEALRALETAVRALGGLGHDAESTSLPRDEGYAPAFRTIWQAGASNLPVTDQNEDLLEPLTRWLVRRGRELSARELATALSTLAAYERDFVARYARYDAVITPALAMTPRPVGWYDAQNPEHNFEQQCQYTPYTSMVNVVGLPALVLPVEVTSGGLPMGVQLIGRPGGEGTLLALGAQLEAALGGAALRAPCW